MEEKKEGEKEKKRMAETSSDDDGYFILPLNLWAVKKAIRCSGLHFSTLHVIEVKSKRKAETYDDEDDTMKEYVDHASFVCMKRSQIKGPTCTHLHVYSQ